MIDEIEHKTILPEFHLNLLRLKNLRFYISSFAGLSSYEAISPEIMTLNSKIAIPGIPW
ncbi:3159_t:CDS:2 [Dentiscutata erythropus]|uniref:3159_t:CDS:1 n=1 Tax=Dentiscutata erythropus TaxID=1348616 RepID=A0A9N9E3X1_9GLOM|nr:3159_t:CDS:2 [Dentiscutata erythropus]